MDGMRHWPNKMLELRDKLIVAADRMGIPQDKHQSLAQEMIESLAALFGGTMLYVPKLEETKRERRDEIIFGEFTGHNLDALCRQYDLSTRQLRRIVAQQSARRFRQQQSTLPFI